MFCYVTCHKDELKITIKEKKSKMPWGSLKIISWEKNRRMSLNYSWIEVKLLKHRTPRRMTKSNESVLLCHMSQGWTLKEKNKDAMREFKNHILGEIRSMQKSIKSIFDIWQMRLMTFATVLWMRQLRFKSIYRYEIWHMRHMT